MEGRTECPTCRTQTVNLQTNVCERCGIWTPASLTRIRKTPIWRFTKEYIKDGAATVLALPFLL
jgi:ribosomal protein L37E